MTAQTCIFFCKSLFPHLRSFSTRVSKYLLILLCQKVLLKEPKLCMNCLYELSLSKNKLLCLRNIYFVVHCLALLNVFCLTLLKI